MQSLEIKGLDELVSRIEKVVENMPERRRKLHTTLAERLKASVDAEIAVSVNDSHGKIRSWQEAKVGSGGGYAAVRAVKGGSGADSPGAITNYLESGHKIRPAGSGKNYRPRIRVPYVNGKHFYAAVRGRIAGEVMAAGEDFIKEIARDIQK